MFIYQRCLATSLLLTLDSDNMPPAFPSNQHALMASVLALILWFVTWCPDSLPVFCGLQAFQSQLASKIKEGPQMGHDPSYIIDLSQALSLPETTSSLLSLFTQPTLTLIPFISYRKTFLISPVTLVIYSYIPLGSCTWSDFHIAISLLTPFPVT